jgi:FAD-dependent urate hydroxylase
VVSSVRDGKVSEQRSTAGTSRSLHVARCPVVIIGAGPYGLSAAAHLTRAGVNVRVFGEPMESWAQHMPAGMFLRSRRTALNIADPDHALGLGDYESASGLEHAQPVPVERFVDYGRWFQKNAVPDLERRRVAHVSSDSNRFRVELDDGETLRADRVVVATGITPFGWHPPQFAGLPSSLVSHTSDHHDLGAFGGRRVAVIGGGQSAFESAALLAESGAEVEVLVRGHTIRWLLPEDSSWTDPRLRYYARSKISMGSPRSAWLAARPGLFRWLPDRMREPLTNRYRRTAVAARLRPRLSKVPITTGRSVVSASPRGEELVLKLDDGSTREVDHLLLATGYRLDLARLAFLEPELLGRVRMLGRVRTRDSSPVLAAGFESSVRGLHFLGAPAGRTFGPVMHHVCGTWAAARGLTRAVVGRSAPRQGFSW